MSMLRVQLEDAIKRGICARINKVPSNYEQVLPNQLVSAFYKDEIGCCADELENIIQPMLNSLLWAFHHASLDSDSTSGEQEDFDYQREKAWDVLQMFVTKLPK